MLTLKCFQFEIVTTKAQKKMIIVNQFSLSLKLTPDLLIQQSFPSAKISQYFNLLFTNIEHI